MHIRNISSLLIIISLFMIFGNQQLTGSSADSAWQALHSFKISEAKTLFEKALDENPEDPALMRGRMLTAYLDMDQETYYRMIDEMIKADPSNPYLLAIFEHNAAEMTDWAKQFEYASKIGKALSGNASGALAYLGKKILESYYFSSLEKKPKDLIPSLGYAPGGWLIGPFNNESNISAYRALPQENFPLDTLTMAEGKQGQRIGWCWVESGPFGDFIPQIAMETDYEIAIQMRFFFELPQAQKVLITPSGAHSCRMLIDGEKVYDDPVHRNAHQRFGIEADLSEGIHEITLALSHEYQGLLVSISILNADYETVRGLEWLRYSDQVNGDLRNYRALHPIFDTFNANMENNPSPDAIFLKTMMQIYNGYAKEAVEELEQLQRTEGLTQLETLALIDALNMNSEETIALEYLDQLHQNNSTPLTDMAWIGEAVDDYELAINSYVELANTYPGRPEIEASAALKPLLNNDNKTLFENLENLKKKYPEFLAIHELLYNIYLDYIDDPESAYEEFKQYCDKGKAGLVYLSNASDYFIWMGKYDKAMEVAHEDWENNPFSDAALAQLAYVSNLARKEKELVPLFEEIRAKYPYNIDNLSRLFNIYENAAMYDEARHILEEIHYIKPTAIMPYQRIDSLHNGFDYDSIFGSIDAMELWDIEPSEQEMGSQNMWSLIDRQQIVVFESGLVLKDFHWGYILTDQEAVESVQEFNLGFDPNAGSNSLILARRLRKGQPPLSGEVSGSYVLFRDLKPGDAIEFHYRIWSQNSGDLWQHFWRKFTINSSFFQRNMEYTILTNRDDLNYYSDSIAGKPDIQDEYCGFKRTTWMRENIPAQNLDLSLLPPKDDIVGQTLVSTLPDWNSLNAWYKSISDAILDYNPRSEKLAQELTAGKNSDFEKLRALYEHIIIDIPYQQIGFDYHAAIPRKPDQVLVNGWGDCKDKSHLLIKMLNSSGIQAWPVLVMSRSEGTKLPLAFFGFNHLIAAAIVDGDTVYVDPSDVPFPPASSIGISLGGQPCVNISGQDAAGLDFLPAYGPSDRDMRQSFEIVHEDSSQFEITCKTLHYNAQAGYRRNNLKQFTAGELKRNLESGLSDRWGVRFILDSMEYDSVAKVDSEFVEKWQGKVFLGIQNVSDIAIVSMPDFSIFKKGFVSQLTDNGMREFPVDLRSYTGHYTIEASIQTPALYGVPETGENISMADSLYSFELTSEWNPENRKLILNYEIEIGDGLVDPNGFINFVQKVTEVFDKPIVFNAE